MGDGDLVCLKVGSLQEGDLVCVGVLDFGEVEKQMPMLMTELNVLTFQGARYIQDRCFKVMKNIQQSICDSSNDKLLLENFIDSEGK